MPGVEDFMDEVVAEYRRRLALLGDNGDRRAVEDGIALLTDYRLSDMDGERFEKLLSMLRAGRSPVGLTVLRPEAIGEELARRWAAYGARAADKDFAQGAMASSFGAAPLRDGAPRGLKARAATQDKQLSNTLATAG
jgi:hypothetical protein